MTRNGRFGVGIIVRTSKKVPLLQGQIKKRFLTFSEAEKEKNMPVKTKISLVARLLFSSL